jgi:hypothetical protein
MNSREKILPAIVNAGVFREFIFVLESAFQFTKLRQDKNMQPNQTLEPTAIAVAHL